MKSIELAVLPIAFLAYHVKSEADFSHSELLKFLYREASINV
jgi:hypothetical protein